MTQRSPEKQWSPEPQWYPEPDPDEASAKVTAAFAEAYGRRPDGVWAAPGRVNLIGEHVDYNAGLCLPFALPHRTYVALAARDDDAVRIRSVQEPVGELVRSFVGGRAGTGPGMGKLPGRRRLGAAGRGWAATTPGGSGWPQPVSARRTRSPGWSGRRSCC